MTSDRQSKITAGEKHYKTLTSSVSTIVSVSEKGRKITSTEAELLDVVWTNVFIVFLLAIHRHLY
jgi:hypothetical protein